MNIIFTKRNSLTKTLITMMLWLTAIAGFAQKVTVNGTIQDRDDLKPVGYADVIAYLEADTAKKIVDMILTDDKGAFTLELPAGNYIMEIEYVGYKKYTRKLSVSNNQPTINLRSIKLRPDEEQLEAAVVTAKAIAVQTKEDTVEYNANSFKVQEGAAIEALVKKLPGAQISSDGKLTVNGKEIKRILVDGKEFFSDDPNVALKNLPANMVDKIKAYEKKSDENRLTGMDDGEEEMVLDLKVKKGMMHGWFGNAEAGLGGTPFHFDASTMLNRFDDDQNISLIARGNDVGNSGFSERGGGPRASGSAGKGINTTGMGGVNYVKDKKELKYGGNARYGYSENDSRKRSINKHFAFDNTEKDTVKEIRQRHDVGLDFQVEWKPTETATLIVKPNLSYAKTDIESDKHLTSFKKDSLLLNESRGTSSTDGNNFGAGGTIRYVQQLTSKKGRNFSLNASANYDRGESDVVNVNNTRFHFYNDADEQEMADSVSAYIRTSQILNNSWNYQVSAAFTEPISTHHLMQLRYTFKDRETESHSYVYDGIKNFEKMDSTLSTRVKNSYSTHDIELSLQGNFTKLKYKAGFNLTPQRSESENFIGINAGKNAQNVFNISPNLMVRYLFNKKHTLMFRYRGQSSAPSIENLQEIIDQTDPMNIKYGNPKLQPSYTQNMRLRYANYFSELQSNLNMNLSFSNTFNDVTNRVIYDQKSGAKQSYKENVDGNWNASALATYNTPLGNSPFSANATTQGGMSEKVGFSSSKNDPDKNGVKSTTQNYNLGQKLGLNFSKDDYEIGITGSIAYVNTHNTLNSANDRNTFDYQVGGNANVLLGWKIFLGTDLNYKFYSGYDSKISNDNEVKNGEVIWNAQLSRSFMKNNAATVRIKYFDILQQQSNLSSSSTADSYSEAIYNTLGSYFMVYFSYKFNSLARAEAEEKMQERGGMRGPGSMEFGPGGPRQRGDWGGMREGGSPRERVREGGAPQESVREGESNEKQPRERGSRRQKKNAEEGTNNAENAPAAPAATPAE